MFRIGDEVEAIHLEPFGTIYDDSLSRLSLKTTYTVSGVCAWCIYLAEVQSGHPLGVWSPDRFRKVERRDWHAWLATAAPVDPALPSPPVKPREVETAS